MAGSSVSSVEGTRAGSYEGEDVQVPSSSHVVFLLLVVKSNTIAMPNCFFPLTSQSKARVSMSGPTLDRDTMLLRGSPPHAGSISEGVGTGSIVSFFLVFPGAPTTCSYGTNSVTVAR